MSKTHGYEITYKHKYKCQSSFCGRVYGRQSKSIDVSKKVCGACKGRLMLVEDDGMTPKKPKKLTDYQRFVKKNSTRVRRRLAKDLPKGQGIKKVNGSEVVKRRAEKARLGRSFLIPSTVL